MDTLQLEKEVKYDSMESWEIESQLNEIGVPYVPISWQDEFLMAENLQNYFAEVIARISTILRKATSLSDYEKHKLMNMKLNWISIRDIYRKLSKAEKQQILLDLIQDSRNLTAKYDY